MDNALTMDYTKEFTTNESFETRDEMVRWVRDTAKELGMVIIVKRSDSGDGSRQPRVFLSCERSGQYRSSKGKSSLGGNHNAIDEEKEKGEKSVVRKKPSGTKKCDCPFVLKGSQKSIGGHWVLEVLCGVHNHPCAQVLEGHSFAGRLTPAEEKLVLDMSKNDYRPKDILHILKERFPQNTSTLKTIYNVRQKHKLVEHGGQSQMEYLMAKLQEHGYFYRHRLCDKSCTVKDIFFAHPTSVDLLRAFPSVLLMDCTCKTNQDGLPLLEIAGRTSTDVTFSAACVYMESAHEDNYMWALSILKSLFDQSSFPTMIVTNLEVALMNAIESTFPTSRHFLCRFHIRRNILENCKKMIWIKEKRDSFILSWNMLALAKTEGKFYELLRKFQEDNSKYPDAVQYAMNQWIQPFKDRFVSCWKNNVMHFGNTTMNRDEDITVWTNNGIHFGNTTMNRAERKHTKLKRQLGSAQGNFETCWTGVHALIETLHNEVKQSFEKSKNVVQHRYKASIFKSLRGMVSTSALDKIVDEMKVVNAIGVDPLLCGCVLRKTCGLPCAHELAEFVRVDMPIPLDVVDSFWRKLDMEPSKEGPSKEGDINVRDDIEYRWHQAVANLNKSFSMASESQKLLMLERLDKIANPTTTSLLVPEVNTRIHGLPTPPKTAKLKPATSTKRERSAFEGVESIKHCSPAEDIFVANGPISNKLLLSTTRRQKQKVVRRETRASSLVYIDQLPSHLHKYITGTKDVVSDGHCGFRAIGDLLGFGDNAWDQVRRDLLEELTNFEELYAAIYGEHGRVQKQIELLNCFDETATSSHWMSLPETGYLVASRYNVALVTLSVQHCCTFLPLRTSFTTLPTCVCIGFVNGNHFIQVFLREGHPLPPIIPKWYGWRYQCAAVWDVVYTQQLAMYNRIKSTTGSNPSSLPPPIWDCSSSSTSICS